MIYCCFRGQKSVWRGKWLKSKVIQSLLGIIQVLLLSLHDHSIEWLPKEEFGFRVYIIWAVGVMLSKEKIFEKYGCLLEICLFINDEVWVVLCIFMLVYLTFFSYELFWCVWFVLLWMYVPVHCVSSFFFVTRMLDLYFCFLLCIFELCLGICGSVA